MFILQEISYLKHSSPLAFSSDGQFDRKWKVQLELVYCIFQH